MDECLDKHNEDIDAAFAEYEVLRKVNADAIADLALQNFIEMRDLVGDKDFLHYKAVEHNLCELHPDLFKSQYEMVTFSNVPYSVAQNKGAQNTRMVNEIIANGWEDKISDRTFVLDMLSKYEGASA
jgi:kynurenine 3-monooxygenase